MCGYLHVTLGYYKLSKVEIIQLLMITPNTFVHEFIIDRRYDGLWEHVILFTVHTSHIRL